MTHSNALVVAVPESNGVEYDSATRPPLKGEPWAVFILFIDDGNRLVLIRFTAIVNAYSNCPFFVLDDQVNPLVQFHF